MQHVVKSCMRIKIKSLSGSVYSATVSVSQDTGCDVVVSLISSLYLGDVKKRKQPGAASPLSMVDHAPSAARCPPPQPAVKDSGLVRSRGSLFMWPSPGMSSSCICTVLRLGHSGLPALASSSDTVILVPSVRRDSNTEDSARSS